MSKQTTAVAKKEETAVVFTTEMPSYLANQQQTGRGMEDVTANDLIIPRLELVQSLSPARDKTSPAFIPGAEEGSLFNNVTRELYGAEAYVVPVVYKKQWLVWKDRKQGGGSNGFRGAFNSEQEAKAKIAELAPTEQGLEAVETAQHFCYVIKSTGQVEEVVISMAKSKLKVSKRWNSLMRIGGGDCFSRVYKVSAVVEANAKGEKYQNLAIAPAGYTPEEIYRKAENLYNQIHRGGVVVSNDYEDGGGAPTSEEF